MQEIRQANAENGATFRLAPNKFGDYTPAEYKKLLGYKASAPAGEVLVLDAATDDSVNWVTKGAVTGVKDQG